MVEKGKYLIYLSSIILFSTQRLRTCSLPNLRLLFETDTEEECMNSSTKESEKNVVGCNSKEPLVVEDSEKRVVDCDEDDDDDDDPDEEVDIDIACEERRVCSYK